MDTQIYRSRQLSALVLLRWLIGWHMMYEGITKIANPSWTAKGYLTSADGLFPGFFQWLASDGLIGVVDFLNMWSLFLIGLCLILGLFGKYAALFGGVLVLFYYLAHPPLFEPSVVPVEGNYLFINKTLIEAVALFVLAFFPTDHIIGINRYINKGK